MKIILIICCLMYSSFINCAQDPFALLGIPSLNPSLIFNDGFSITQPITSKESSTIQTIHTIEDLPQFLQKSNLKPEDNLKVISKFLISDDYLLKKFGAVFDQTGFDGIVDLGEQIYPIGRNERIIQRARSAAKIFFKNNYKSESDEFEAYGAEKILENISLGWEQYKVLLVGRSSVDQHLFLKVCVPLDEMLTAIVSEFNGQCVDKIKYVNEAKFRNAPYLEKIKQNYLGSSGEKNNIINNRNINNSFNMNNLLKIQSPPSAVNNNSPVNRNLPVANINTPMFLMKSELNKKTNMNLLNNNIPSPAVLNQKINSMIITQTPNHFNSINISNNKNLRGSDPKILVGINQQIPQQFSQQFSQQIPQQISLQIHQQNPQQNPQQIHQQIHQSNLQQNPQQIPQQIHQQTPQQIPQQIPHQIPQQVLPLQGLEKEVESINAKLQKLETRVDKEEKITKSTQDDVRDIKSNLDRNFNKLDTILEKLASKLK